MTGCEEAQTHAKIWPYLVLMLGILFSSLMPAAPVAAREHPKTPQHVLILHSYHPGLPWTDRVMAGIQSVLGQPGRQINIDVEYLDTKRHSDPAYFSHVLDTILHYKFKDRSYDLVLVSDNEALNFALGHRDGLFRRTPIVFCGVNSAVPVLADKIEGVTGVYADPDFTGVVSQALALHPATRQIVVIGSTRELSDRINLKQLQALGPAAAPKVAFDFWNNLPADMLRERLAALGAGSIVIINGSITDRTGSLLSFNDQTKLVRSATNVPIYSFWDVYLGAGIVGGPLVAAHKQGTLAAMIAWRVLDGEKASSVPIVHPDQVPYSFDYNELIRLGIPLQKLPEQHLLFNAPASSYQISKSHFWISVAAVSCLLGVALLLTWSIVQRRRAETGLRESEQKFRELAQQFQIVLDGIPDSITLISKEMKVIWSNKGAVNSVTSHPPSIPLEDCCNLLYNRTSICDNCPAVKAFISATAEESIITTPDQRILEVQAFPVSGGAQEISYVILLASDITEKTRLLDETTRTKRLAALGELAAGVAHEINNPNALILFNADLVKKACGDAAPILMRHYDEHGDFTLAGIPYVEMRDEMPHLFSEMFESADRIKRIVNDLRDFARADAPDLREMVDLNQRVESSIRLVGNAIKTATDKLSVELAENLPPFVGNPQHIEQVTVNLIMNACQALPDKERGIHISTWFSKERNSSVITVRDEGIGIGKKDISQITDPFFTTKRAIGGSGLGLSVSMRIVRNYGGSLEFSSELYKGTTVHLYLPVKQEAIEV
uniref:histidine kinase n=1 Tax=Geobacter sp. (strain M21) TaxID=443144 RepID=C6E757_GEOSM